MKTCILKKDCWRKKGRKPKSVDWLMLVGYIITCQRGQRAIFFCVARISRTEGRNMRRSRLCARLPWRESHVRCALRTIPGGVVTVHSPCLFLRARVSRPLRAAKMAALPGGVNSYLIFEWLPWAQTSANMISISRLGHACKLACLRLVTFQKSI